MSAMTRIHEGGSSPAMPGPQANQSASMAGPERTARLHLRTA